MYARVFHWKPLLAVVCLLMAAQPARAQAFDATHLSEPAQFTMPLLCHGGDDLNWARSDYDDSRWMVVDPNRDLKAYFRDQPRPAVVWYRLHVKVSPVQTGMAIEENNLASAFEIFVNGRRMLTNGSVSPFVPRTTGAYLQAPIPKEEAATGSLVIALRVHLSKSEWQETEPGLCPTKLVLGQASSIRDRFWLEQIGASLQKYGNDIFFLGLGCVALALFVAQRKRSEYLWLFLVGLLGGAADLRSSVLLAHNFPLLFAGITSLIFPAFELSLVGLGLGFVGVRLTTRMKLLIGFATLLFSVGSLSSEILWLGDWVEVLLCAPLLQIIFVAIPIVFLVHFRRGNPEAGVLLIPWLMQTVNVEFQDIVFWLYQIPSLRGSILHFYRLVTNYRAGPFSLTLGGCIDGLVLISWSLILVWRSIRITREQTLIENEMEAARQVQQVILPQESYVVPGFAVEAVYKPAQQVGGDFFQVLPVAGARRRRGRQRYARCHAGRCARGYSADSGAVHMRSTRDSR